MSRIKWSNLENFIVYDETLMGPCDFIQNSIYCLESNKFFTPRFKFLVDKETEDTITLSMWIEESTVGRNNNRPSQFYDNNMNNTRTPEMKEIQVHIIMHKEYFENLLIECSAEKSCIWAKETFEKLIVKGSIDLANNLTSKFETNFFSISKSYVLSSGSGNIYSTDGSLVGVFSGLLLKPNKDIDRRNWKNTIEPAAMTIELPQVLFNSRYKAGASIAVYNKSDTGISITFECKHLKQFSLEDSWSIPIKRATITKESLGSTGFEDGDYSALMNKKLWLFDSKEEFRFNSLKSWAPVIHKDASVEHFGLKTNTRFKDLLAKEAN